MHTFTPKTPSGCNQPVAALCDYMCIHCSGGRRAGKQAGCDSGGIRQGCVLGGCVCGVILQVAECVGSVWSGQQLLPGLGPTIPRLGEVVEGGGGLTGP